MAVRGRNGNLIRLASVYAPVQHHAHDSQDDFFNQLQHWTEMPGLWLAGGDFNFNLEEDVPITSQCLTSSTGTWRRSVTKPWGHNLDGFALPLSSCLMLRFKVCMTGAVRSTAHWSLLWKMLLIRFNISLGIDPRLFWDSPVLWNVDRCSNSF